MRKSGHTYEQIADDLGINVSAAYRHVVLALQAIREKTNEAAEEVRTLEITRIDAMIGILWPRVTKGDYLAMDRVIKLMERRSKLLGLDAPTKSEAADALLIQVEYVNSPYTTAELPPGTDADSTKTEQV